MKIRLLVLAVLTLLFLGASFQSVTVYLDKNQVSSRGVVVNGEVYIPAKDVAKVLYAQVQWKPGSKVLYLATSGGTGQEDAVEAKVGAWAFNGETRFMVHKLNWKEEGGKRWLQASLEIRNATKKTREYQAGTYWSSTKYYFADDEGNTYTAESAGPSGLRKELPPGAALTYQIGAQVPEGKKVTKLLVYLNSYLWENYGKEKPFRIFVSMEAIRGE